MSYDSTKTEAPPGDAWAWATEHRAPGRASTQQLVGWLARGELPPHTLVWKPGWGEWLPAMQVAELAHAFPSVTPGSRRVARAAPDGSVMLPPVPVANYPRLRLLAKDVVGESAVAPFTGVSQGLVPAQAVRRSLRDLDYVQKDLVTSQVPAAAMLEAARAMKPEGPPPTPGNAARLGRLDLGTFGDQSLPASAQVSGVESSITPPRRTLSPHALELVFPAEPEPEPFDNPWRPSRRYGRWISLGVLVGGVLGLLAVRGPSPEPSAPTVTGAERAALLPEPIEARVVTGACRPSLKVVRLDERASRDVPPMVASLSGRATLAEASPSAEVSIAAGWVAVGYAQGHETAVGLALSPESLEPQQLVARRMPRPIFSVSPIVRDGELAFDADFAAPKPIWQPPRDSKARFGRPALASGGGTTALAVAARSGDGSRQSIWLSHAVEGELPLVLQPFEPMPDEPIGGGRGDLDAPAIAALPGGGFGLLFTQGDGWKRRVRLQQLSSTLAPLGAPVDVTTPDRALRGASVGALYWVKDRLLAFYFIARDGGASLWVSSVECELG